MAEAFDYAQLQGIGGKGAPHVMRLDRLESTGLSNLIWIPPVMILSPKCLFLNHPVLGRNSPGVFGLPLLEQSALHPKPCRCNSEENMLTLCTDSFRIHLHPRGPAFIRTKQWMSDAEWQPTVFLFLPASVVQECQGTVPPGG